MKKLQTFEFYYPLILGVWACFMSFYGLGHLEFFRHTEADRTLIAWEMLETGRYLVPHILSDPILTKPPLYYWLSAATISLFSEPSEFAARTLTAVFAVIFVLMVYGVNRAVRLTKKESFLAASLFGSSMLFFDKSVVAEIDLLYSFFTSLALFLCFFALMKESFGLTVASYLVAGIAFLTKGPPVVLFYAVSSPVFFLMLRHVRAMRCDGFVPPRWKPFLLYNIAGVIVFILIVASWVYPLSQEVGLQELEHQLQVEVIDRAFNHEGHSRGSFYYFNGLFNGFLPWSGILILLVSAVGFFLSKDKRTKYEFTKVSRAFFYFNCLVAFSGFILLSAADGKSTRYILPLFPFFSQLIVVLIIPLSKDFLSNFRNLWLRYFLSSVVLGLAITPFVYLPPGVNSKQMILGCYVLLCAGAYLVYCLSTRKMAKVFVSILVLVTCLRVAQHQIYIPARNHTRSVKPFVYEIDSAVPNNTRIFTLGMFERWLAYYLKREGREVVQLNKSSKLGALPNELYVMFSVEDDRDYIDCLGDAEKISKFNNRKDRVALMKVSKTSIDYALQNCGENIKR